jgi:UDP-glucose:(heptosyl)LPS alpha-1,3-glucosyltransferase
MNVQKIVLGIHDLNTWGGQERSNLEIFRRLNTQIPIELHAYTFADDSAWPQLKHISYSPAWSNPILLKINHFHAQSALRLRSYRSRNKENGILIQSTGTAFPISDVVQVQFLHKAWYDIKHSLDEHLKIPESTLRNYYSTAFEYCNLFHEQLLYRPNKKYIAISHTVKKDLMRLYNIKSENISVIYHGVDKRDFRSLQAPEAQISRRDVREKLNIPQDAHVMLSVGAINTRKGIHTAVEVLNELIKNDFKNVFLLAVGAGDVHQIMQQADKLGISANIRFVSSQKDVAPYYQASDIFFFPTLYEPFGLVILEAMASGLPVITTSIAGAAELITPGVDGLVITPQNKTTEIASHVSSLIKDKQKWLSLSHRSQQSVLHWTWDKVAKEYADFYSSI